MPNKTKIAITGVAVLALIAALAWAVFGNSAAEEPADPQTKASQTATPSDGGEGAEGGASEVDEEEELGGPDEGLEEGSESDVATSSAAVEVAARAWVDHSGDRAAWASKVQPLFREQAWPSFDLPDPLRIGPTEVTGEPVAVDVSVETADFLVPTDAGDLEVSLYKEGEEWRVTDVDKELAPADSTAGSDWADRPLVGAGDPMLGVTDGTEQPEVEDVPTGELESTNALEQGERIRRALESNASAGPWATELAAHAEPTFAMALPHVDRSVFADAPTATVEVEQDYRLGDERAPFALISALDGDGAIVWTATMQPTASKADSSVVVWAVSSIDFEDPAVLDDRVGPMSEDVRRLLLDGAARSTAPLFTQEIGDSEETLQADLAETMSAPDKAVAAGLPFPELNTRAGAGEWTNSVFVTPAGSDKIWVSVTNTATIGSVTGDLTDEQVTRTVFVRIAFIDGSWVVEDAQLDAPTA